ncbi:MAG: nucleotidyltransferase domain-containing protein [Bacteroidales bacterium]|nr:nucleotidyltransferase domain-containing protein [Bacteroidales bacterium]
MGKREAIAVVRQYKDLVLDHFGSATVYLYGSYSKGKARPDSDIDVAVVVPEVHDDFLKASALLWSLTWNVNTLIEPVLIDASHPSPLYEDVLQTGVCV